jgi:putative Mg2+ transporter-C (MgtC) family protein
MTDSILGQIIATLQYELSDLPNVTDVTKVLFRLVIAALLGGILGYERESKGKAAGLRTYMLVAIGAAFFVMVPKLSGMSDDAVSRIIQGLVTGIGFLGAGSIIKARDEAEIKGLTTAAGLWLTTAIGIAAGLGRDATAILGTILAFIILSFLPKVERRGIREDLKSNGDFKGQ